MSGSSAFQRIERDVLRCAAAIPAGRVCTYADLGTLIDVPARHVAYILARLDKATRERVPVHRLVGAGGKLPAKPQHIAADISAKLTNEGVAITKGAVLQWAQLRKADLYQMYAKVKAQYPRTSLNLLYAMMGAVDNQDWRAVAKDRRTEVLMRLEDMGLL